MVQEVDLYWYVAAVFRDPSDLATTVEEMRFHNLAAGQLLVIAKHGHDDARKVLDNTGADRVRILSRRAEGSLAGAPEIVSPGDVSPGLNALLDAMDAGGDAGGPDGAHEAAPSRDDGQHRSQVYAQLRQDVAAGALVLVASLANPEEQLQGARIMLRGNCECVLTHEIAAAAN